MSDEDKNKNPETDDPQFDDDLESLSDEEKSAFEKIMAEIAPPEGKLAPKSDETTPVDTVNEGAPEASPETEESSVADQAQKADSQSGSSAHAGDDPPPDGASSQPDDSPKQGSEEADDELTDEQQAALDKIMAEIEGQTQPDKTTDTAAANPADDDAEQGLSDEQQAALDKIMGEINERKEADAPAAAQAPTDTDDAEQELSDEQQAALDKIMGEINERKEADTPPAAEAAPAADDADDELSIEEFNEELTNLLNGVEGESAGAETEKHPKQPPAQSSTNEPDTDPQEQTAPYTMLKEVAASENTASSAGSKRKLPGERSIGIKKVLYYSAAVSIVIALIGLGAWAYRFFDADPSSNTPESIVASESSPKTKPEQAAAPTDNGESVLPAQVHAAAESEISTDSPFTVIRHDLEDAREQLAAKKRELQDLKTYYQKGISEEQSKITAIAASTKLTDYPAAMKNAQVELALRSIQRRMIYLNKLDTPLNQMDAALEELLYWQRRTQLLELLSRGISGLPVSEFKQEVKRITQHHLEKSQQLSIENIEVSKPKLATIWKELTTKKDGTRAAAAQKTRLGKKDLAIGKEICSGNFEHLYLLTSITDEAAACLVRWSGKDLYLNGLTHLSPAAARSLAQWPGERLSLNGIRSLSAEAAKYLSQWPGKWLSLNGLTRLPNEATNYLAQWQGEQLEMVGLNSIGRWENYVTRLYLSEELRRKLEIQ